ncbi:MAG: hypothetical protein KAQ85_05005 [Thermodesulfovibrionia bacterium]|nr:hypothetical protein [Thermodesulfovibrionia bacterium]
MKLLFDMLKLLKPDNLMTKRIMVFSGILLGLAIAIFLAANYTQVFMLTLLFGLMTVLIGLVLYMIWKGVCESIN